MKLAWFGVEEWLNPMDSLARINLGSSCVSALRMDELFDLTGEDLDAFLNEMRTMSLHYHHGDATGSPRIKAAVAGIYPKGNVKPEEVMITHGGTGANDLVLMSVLEPGDNCVVIKPSYQQHYDIPKGSGIETRVVQLKAEDNYQLDFDALDKACDANTKMIVLTNPNNPIGVTLYDEGLRMRTTLASSSAASISSITQNGVGCTFRMAKYSAMATNAFSPPDSSVMVFSCLPGGCTLISMPQLRISLSSSSSSRALPPPNSSKNVSWKLSFSSWNCSAKMLVICWVIWSIMPSSSSLACSTSLRCSDR